MSDPVGGREKDTPSPGRLDGLASSALVEQRPDTSQAPQTAHPPQESQPPQAPPRVDRAWARRLREDARRSLSENLAEGIALSHVLVRYADAATPRRPQRQ
jgi:hypothetical protein